MAFYFKICYNKRSKHSVIISEGGAFMNIIEENLEKALDGDFRNSILNSYLFRSNLKDILGKKAKSIHRNLFKQKRVELVLNKGDIEIKQG